MRMLRIDETKTNTENEKGKKEKKKKKKERIIKQTVAMDKLNSFSQSKYDPKISMTMWLLVRLGGLVYNTNFGGQHYQGMMISVDVYFFLCVVIFFLVQVKV